MKVGRARRPDVNKRGRQVNIETRSSSCTKRNEYPFRKVARINSKTAWSIWRRQTSAREDEIARGTFLSVREFPTKFQNLDFEFHYLPNLLRNKDFIKNISCVNLCNTIYIFF